MIEAKGLTKRYGGTVAVDDLSFTVPPGQVTGFLGPNGAGKSTTMRLILGLDAADSGSVTVDGRPYPACRRPLFRAGALLEARTFHGGRSARNHLLCLALSNGIGRARVDDVLDLVGLCTLLRTLAAEGRTVLLSSHRGARAPALVRVRRVLPVRGGRPGRRVRPDRAPRRMTEGSTMLTAEADIRTEHAARYLARLCGHAGKMGTAGHRISHRRPSHAPGDAPPEVRRVECSGTEGTVSLDWGQWTMRAFPGRLAVRAEAADEENLRRIQELLTARLQKFGRRERLTVTWQDTGG